jgi:hypothetical protein
MHSGARLETRLSAWRPDRMTIAGASLDPQSDGLLRQDWSDARLFRNIL